MNSSCDPAFALYVEDLRNVSEGAILYSAYLVPSRKMHHALHEWSGVATLISAAGLFEVCSKINAKHSSKTGWFHRISADVKLPEPPFVISRVESIVYAAVQVKLASTELLEIVEGVLEGRLSYCATVMLGDNAAVLFLNGVQENIASGMIYCLGDFHCPDLIDVTLELTDEIDGELVGTIQSIGHVYEHRCCGSKD